MTDWPNLCYASSSKDRRIIRLVADSRLAVGMLIRDHSDANHLSLKVCLFASTVSLFSSVCIVRFLPGARGYEISIYSAYPLYFWFLLATAMAGPLVTFVIVGHTGSKKLSCAMLVTGSLAAFEFLSLPSIRGYFFFSGGDSLSHLGFVSDILHSGHVGISNMYPIVHIWTIAVAKMAAIDVRGVMLLFPQFLFLIYLVSVAILVRELGFKAREAIITISIALFPLYGAEHLYFVPSAEAFFLIPLVLFIAFRAKRRFNTSPFIWSMPLVSMLVLFPFFHPEASLFLFIFLVIMNARRKTRSSDKTWSAEFKSQEWRSTTIPALILLTGFAIWFCTSVAFGNTVVRVYQNLVLNLGRAPVDVYITAINKSNLGYYEIADLALRIYGATAVIAIFGLPLLLRYLISRRRNLCLSNTQLFLVTSYFCMLVIVILFMTVDLVIGPRPIKYLLFVATVIAGQEIFHHILSARPSILANLKNRLKATFFVALLLFVLVVSMSNTYPSPHTLLPNYQVTEADFNGMDFFFAVRNQGIQTLDITINQKRYADAILGVEAEKKNLRYGNITLPIDHFGYNSDATMGNHYVLCQYLVIDERAELYYPEIFPNYSEQWRYSPSDFEMLGDDISVDWVCDNGGIQILLVEGLASP